MTRGYKELVGLRVTFEKATPEYSMAHYYQWKHDGEKGPVLVMPGYKMLLTEKQDAVVASLRNAYAPAVLSIWALDVPGSTEEYLQFEVGARPDAVGLGDDWSIVAEW